MAMDAAALAPRSDDDRIRFPRPWQCAAARPAAALRRPRALTGGSAEAALADGRRCAAAALDRLPSSRPAPGPAQPRPAPPRPAPTAAQMGATALAAAGAAPARAAGRPGPRAPPRPMATPTSRCCWRPAPARAGGRREPGWRADE
eukprot:tig00000449_g935.t1